jgi:hypothetical protein
VCGVCGAGLSESIPKSLEELEQIKPPSFRIRTPSGRPGIVGLMAGMVLLVGGGLLALSDFRQPSVLGYIGFLIMVLGGATVFALLSGASPISFRFRQDADREDQNERDLESGAAD